MKLNPNVARHFRKPLGQGHPDRDLIGGLLQMYAFINAWGKVAVEIGCAAGEIPDITGYVSG